MPQEPIIQAGTSYLYYPHAPILLRVVRHVGRTAKADGGYRWKGKANREGYLSNTEAEMDIKHGWLIIVDADEAKRIVERLPDLIKSRMAFSKNRADLVD
jgi:hypothetical protein